MLEKFSKGFWFIFLPTVVLGLLGVVLLATGIIPIGYAVISILMWMLIAGLGIAVGYHRVFSHRTHNLPIWKENIILFFATFAAQGGPIFWVAVHRGYHHPYADQERDIHSPNIYGKRHAFVGWLLENVEHNNRVNLKYAVDLLRKPNFVWFHNNYLKILWFVPILTAIIDWQLAFALFWIPGGIAALQDNMVNVYGHTKTFYSYRNFDTNDKSENNFLLGYFAWGQGWHNNHHANPAEYNFGGRKWWEWDPTRIFLSFLK